MILLLAMLCYMPTWSLTNAIAMANAPSEKFPQIRVFGSIGWVAAGLFGVLALWVFNGEDRRHSDSPVLRRRHGPHGGDAEPDAAEHTAAGQGPESLRWWTSSACGRWGS